MSNTPKETDPTAYTINDPNEFAQNMMRLIEQGSKAMTGLLSQTDSSASPWSSAQEMAEATRTIGDISQRWMADPTKLLDAQNELAQGYAEIWNTTLRRMMGDEPEPIA